MFYLHQAIFMIPTNPPPTFRKPELWSDDFTDFVKKCLVKSPEQRATATQLLQVSADTEGWLLQLIPDAGQPALQSRDLPLKTWTVHCGACVELLCIFFVLRLFPVHFLAFPFSPPWGSCLCRFISKAFPWLGLSPWTLCSSNICNIHKSKIPELLENVTS